MRFFEKLIIKTILRVFLENRASSLFYIYNGLTSCNVSQKTNDGKYENFLSQTDRQTDRLTDDLNAIHSVGLSVGHAM